MLLNAGLYQRVYLLEALALPRSGWRFKRDGCLPMGMPTVHNWTGRSFVSNARFLFREVVGSTPDRVTPKTYLDNRYFSQFWLMLKFTIDNPRPVWRNIKAIHMNVWDIFGENETASQWCSTIKSTWPEMSVDHQIGISKQNIAFQLIWDDRHQTIITNKNLLIPNSHTASWYPDHLMSAYVVRGWGVSSVG